MLIQLARHLPAMPTMVDVGLEAISGSRNPADWGTVNCIKVLAATPMESLNSEIYRFENPMVEWLVVRAPCYSHFFLENLKNPRHG